MPALPTTTSQPPLVMDEKPAAAPMPPPIRRGLTPLRLLLAVGYIALGACAYWQFSARPILLAPNPDGLSPIPPSREHVAAAGELVPLEAHIMSKCPDAKDCLRDLVLPAMQRIHDKVNFTLSFIGKPTDQDGVACRHGPEECLGNIIELCAQKLYPDPKTSLGFTMCLTRDYQRIPQRGLIEDCALEHAIDFAALNACATKDNGALGVGMLRDSVERTAAAGVTKSCTVRLNNAIYCVRDDATWTDCPSGPAVPDLVSAIERLFNAPPQSHSA